MADTNTLPADINARLDYAGEQEYRFNERITNMIAEGYDTSILDREYPLYVANQVPSFSTTPQDNPELNLMFMARDYITNPDLENSEPHIQAYNAFMSRRQTEALTENSFGAAGAVKLGQILHFPGFVGEDATYTNTPLNHDARKAYDWTKATQVQYDPSTDRNAKTGEFLLASAGLLADVVSMNKAVAGDMRTVAKAVQAKNALQADSIIGRAVVKHLIKSVGKKTLPKHLATGAKILTQGAEDIFVGLGIATRDLLIEDRPEGQSLKATSKEFVKDFGVGLGMDIVVNTMMNVMYPAAKIGGKIFFDYAGRTKKVVKNADINITKLTEDVSSALRGELDPANIADLKARGFGETAESLEAAQRRITAIKTSKDLGQNELALAQATGMKLNMDITEIDGGFKIVKHAGKKTKTVKVTHIQEVFNELDDDLMKGLVRNPKDVHEIASSMEDLKVTLRYEGTVASPKAKLDLGEFTQSVIPKTGSFNARSKNEALRYVKNAINELGEGAQKSLDDLNVKLSDDFFKNLPNAQADELLLPRQIGTALEQKTYLDYIGKFISHHGTAINKEALDGVLKTLGDTVGKWSLRDPEWVAQQAARQGIKIQKSDGIFYAVDELGTRSFETEDLLGNYIYSKTITDEEYVAFLAKSKNYSMVKDPDTELIKILNPFKDTVAIGSSVEDIMAKNPLLRPKYPLETGPRIAFVTDNPRDVILTGEFIESSASGIAKYMDNYTDMKVAGDILDMKKSKKYVNEAGKRVSINVKKRSWLVESPSTGMKPKVFRSEKALKKFLNTINTPEKTLMYTSAQKGVYVTATANGYTVSKAGMPDQFFKNFDDTSDFIKGLPNQPEMPEALTRSQTYTDQGINAFQDEFKDVNNKNFSTDQNKSELKKAFEVQDENFFKKGRSKIGKGLSNIYAYVRDSRSKVLSIVKGRPDLVPLTGKYHNIVELTKKVQTIQATTHDSLNRLSRIIPEQRRKELGTLLSKELPEEEWAKQSIKISKKELSSEDLEFLHGIRKIFDDASTVNGFTGQIDSITNYFPRLQTLDMMEILDPDASTLTLVKKAMGRELLPAEMKFFSNMRTIDLAGYAIQTDPLSLAKRYIDDTLRSNYIEPAVDDMVDFAVKNMDEVADKLDLEHIMSIAKNARGLNDDPITEIIKNINDEITVLFDKNVRKGIKGSIEKGKFAYNPKSFLNGDLEELSREAISKMTDEEKGLFSAAIAKHGLRNNPINNIMGMVTLSTQGFKPWLPIRNTFQPETHLAPIFGFEAVFEAKKAVANLNADGWEYLHRKGITQAKTPQAMVGITGGDGLVSKLNEKGLKAYKRSDDFDRAVGFMTVRDKLAESMRVSNAWGDQAGDYFIQNTKLYAADPAVRDRVMTEIFAGNLEEATVVYANWINSMTFLDYQAVARPTAFNSFLGKMFGQMGTFATQTLSSRQYFMSRLSKTDRALYAGRAVLGGFALNSAFSAVTGTEVNNFSTFKSMMFTGGPLVETGIAIKDIASGSDFKFSRGTNALLNINKDKRTVSGQLTSLFTPYSTAKNIVQGAGKLAEGEIVPGILQMINAPGKGTKDYSVRTVGDYLRRF